MGSTGGKPYGWRWDDWRRSESIFFLHLLETRQQLVILGSETFSISQSVRGTGEVALGSSDHWQFCQQHHFKSNIPVASVAFLDLVVPFHLILQV